MIRDMRRNGAQPKDTMHKAGVEMSTGMCVVIKNETEVVLPTSETSANVYVVTKERYPSGINAARTNMSDYDDDFVKVAKGEFVGLERYIDGEKFATDQFKANDFQDGSIADLKGKSVAVGTDGKWMKATAPSKYVFENVYMDNGHKLVMIRVESDAVEV